jgi:hypothetical protein
MDGFKLFKNWKKPYRKRSRWFFLDGFKPPAIPNSLAQTVHNLIWDRFCKPFEINFRQFGPKPSIAVYGRFGPKPSGIGPKPSLGPNRL